MQPVQHREIVNVHPIPQRQTIYESRVMPTTVVEQRPVTTVTTSHVAPPPLPAPVYGKPVIS